MKGWNWGHFSLGGGEERKHLSMEIGGKSAFEVSRLGGEQCNGGRKE